MLPGFKSCLDVEVVSLTSFLSAHLPCMMIRGSEGFVERSIGSKEGIILTFTAASFFQFSLPSLAMAVWRQTRKLEAYLTNLREKKNVFVHKQV